MTPSDTLLLLIGQLLADVRHELLYDDSHARLYSQGLLDGLRGETVAPRYPGAQPRRPVTGWPYDPGYDLGDALRRGWAAYHATQKESPPC